MSRATAAGRPLLVIVVICGVAAAGSILALAAAERRVTVTRRVRTGYVACLGLVALVVLGLSFARFGGPQTIVVHAVEDLGSRPIVSQGSQNARLLSLSLNGRPALWRAAVSDFEAHPVAGSGAGTFEQYWLQHRPRIYVSRYAHSIYLESLAEGGAIRLLILAAMLGIPLVTAVRLRADPSVLTALAALLAYMLHAGFDWDWEMPAVTALALTSAIAILVRARDDSPARIAIPFGRVAAAAACAVAFAVGAVCWYGNDALARSASAQGRGDWVTAEKDARTAAAWMPWSDSPDLVLAAALVHRGDARDARGVLRQATHRNPVDWAAWQQLADVTTGGEHARALARAEALNPKGMRRLLHLRRRGALGLAGHG